MFLSKTVAHKKPGAACGRVAQTPGAATLKTVSAVKIPSFIGGFDFFCG
jgi:hypothetical protein